MGATGGRCRVLAVVEATGPGRGASMAGARRGRKTGSSRETLERSGGTVSSGEGGGEEEEGAGGTAR